MAADPDEVERSPYAGLVAVREPGHKLVLSWRHSCVISRPCSELIKQI